MFQSILIICKSSRDGGTVLQNAFGSQNITVGSFLLAVFGYRKRKSETESFTINRFLS